MKLKSGNQKSGYSFAFSCLLVRGPDGKGRRERRKVEILTKKEHFILLKFIPLPTQQNLTSAPPSSFPGNYIRVNPWSRRCPENAAAVAKTTLLTAASMSVLPAALAAAAAFAASVRPAVAS